MAPMQIPEEAYGNNYDLDDDIQMNAPSRSTTPPPFCVREQARDGNCLFRSISDQLYGTPDHHGRIREWCVQYLACERNYFQQFVTEQFDDYLARNRLLGEWADDVEIEALSEMYDCRVEIYVSYSESCFSLMRTFHEACDRKWPNPIRLHYEGRSHYNSLAPRGTFEPICMSLPQRPGGITPGEIEEAAIQRSTQRLEAGQRRSGALEEDRELTDREVIEESVRLSRLEFDHKSAAEMDQALRESKTEWERSERARMDEEVVDSIVQQSVLEEEQKQLSLAMQASKEAFLNTNSEYMALYGLDSFMSPAQGIAPGSSSSGTHDMDGLDMQYPESVMRVWSMGIPLDKCMQAYHLVGDNADEILAVCSQTSAW
mmetsp:Transcript_3880/g.8861  ORF Transcript_3880/g.8861 Transcript_3880/m.8861 type:complete len:373 (+) Transcript_3880:180-1298(+)|eukprot:CAMPEP_0206593488 /NCGR_PEP_ID=MMETSP0325_2-20121206/41693_1 /ASSEMBLY_ACC=CAM_ASM_000347 /TAXON_ID=2866 /ORGANISM="Crypthecodinium cohnii, Strain Seligo" /LENGTH=372 /DNA_ID=CAMNT_0054103537 /DNA_START=70 /DNA_END=1188 /DNA_ORIENTATION=+